MNSDMPEISVLEGSDLAETNLYAHCSNNPVNKPDPTGMVVSRDKAAIEIVRARDNRRIYLQFCRK